MNLFCNGKEWTWNGVSNIKNKNYEGQEAYFHDFYFYKINL